MLGLNPGESRRGRTGASVGFKVVVVVVSVDVVEEMEAVRLGDLALVRLLVWFVGEAVVAML